MPLIKHTLGFVENHDIDFVQETLETLEHLIDAPGLKDEELDVLGELLSNLSGVVEVHQMMEEGMDQRTALNTFMKRVTGAIDT